MSTALQSILLPSICGAGFHWLSYLLLRPSRILEGMIVGGFVLSVVLAAFLSQQFATRGFPLIVQCLVGAVALFSLCVLFWDLSEEAYIYWIRGPTIMESGRMGFSRYIYPGNSGMGYADGLGRLPANVSQAVLWGLSVGLVSTLVTLGWRLITRTSWAREQCCGSLSSR